MNKRQFDNMLRRRANRGGRSGRPPTAQELSMADLLGKQRREAAEEQARQDAARTEVELAFRAMDRIRAWHWLWRAGRLMELVEKRGYHHLHPQTDSGRFRSVRKFLGLPPDPKRHVIDTSVPVVSLHIWTHAPKGSGVVRKANGFREVDSSEEFRLHTRLYDAVLPTDLLKWCKKVIELVESLDLRMGIYQLEELYGSPRAITMEVSTGRAKRGRLVSGGRRRMGKGIAHYGKRMRRCTPERRAQIAKDIDRVRVARGSFYQDQKLVARAFAYENHQ